METFLRKINLSWDLGLRSKNLLAFQVAEMTCKDPVVDRAGVSKLGKREQWPGEYRVLPCVGWTEAEMVTEDGASLVLYPVGKN